MLTIGQAAPLFSKLDHQGNSLNLADLLRKGPVILYFYPRDFTPGCTKEACLFRDAAEDLATLNATVIGVSSDNEASHQKFAETHKLPFPLISDKDRSLSKLYEVMRPLGLGARRMTFVIDPQGKVRGIFHHEIFMENHLQDVKKTLAEISSPA